MISNGLKNLFCVSFNFFCSDPAPNGDPVTDFLPIQKDKVYFVDVMNDVVKAGVNPNGKAYELWAQIEQQTQKVNTPRSAHAEF